jgi:hypothetical protein
MLESGCPDRHVRYTATSATVAQIIELATSSRLTGGASAAVCTLPPISIAAPCGTTSTAITRSMSPSAWSRLIGRGAHHGSKASGGGGGGTGGTTAGRAKGIGGEVSVGKSGCCESIITCSIVQNFLRIRDHLLSLV